MQRKFDIRNICFETLVVDTTWSDETGLWTLNIKNTRTGELAVKTCNVFISAAGALTEPQIPNFPGRELFKGPVFHSARWDHSVELEGKNVGESGVCIQKWDLADPRCPLSPHR